MLIQAWRLFYEPLENTKMSSGNNGKGETRRSNFVDWTVRLVDCWLFTLLCWHLTGNWVWWHLNVVTSWSLRRAWGCMSSWAALAEFFSDETSCSFCCDEAQRYDEPYNVKNRYLFTERTSSKEDIRFGRIDDFSWFFTKWGTWCNFWPKSCWKRRNMIVCAYSLRKTFFLYELSLKENGLSSS